MARQPRITMSSDSVKSEESREQEQVEVLNSNTEVPDARLPDVGADPQLKGQAKALKKEPPKAEAQVKYFRVVRGGYILDRGGYRTMLREGKEISNLNYDIRRLQQQGIKLQAITPEERTGAVIYD